MSNPRPSTKLDENAKDAIKRRVGMLCNIRHRAIAFPFETSQPMLRDIVESTLPDAYLAHIHAIEANEDYCNILDTAQTVRICVDEVILTVNFQTAVPFFHMSGVSKKPGIDFTHQIRPDNAFYTKMSKWAGEMETFRINGRKAERLIKDINKVCNTSGQLFRAWPELINYMNSETANLLGGATRASRIPDELKGLQFNDDKKIATEHLALMSLMKDVPGSNLRVYIQ